MGLCLFERFFCLDPRPPFVGAGWDVTQADEYNSYEGFERHGGGDSPGHDKSARRQELLGRLGTLFMLLGAGLLIDLLWDEGFADYRSLSTAGAAKAESYDTPWSEAGKMIERP